MVPYTISMVKITYCEFNKSNCARYKMSKLLDDMEMPLDIWPSDTMKVLEQMERKFRGNLEEMCPHSLLPGRPVEEQTAATYDNI